MADDGIKKVGLQFTAEGVEEFKGSLKSVSAYTKENYSALKLAESQYTKNTTAMQKLADKQSFLKGQTDAYQQKVRVLTAQLHDMESAEKRDETAISKKRAQLNQATSQLNKYGAQLKDVNLQLKTHSAQLKEWGDALGKTGQKISTVGSTLTKGVTAPISALGAAGVAAWKSIDDAMDTVTEKTGASGDALADMQNRVKSIASTIPVDFQDAGDAVGEINTRFGLTGDTLEDLSTQFLEFSKINGTDVPASVDKVSAVMNAFGEDTSDVSSILDSFNVVGQKTGISMDTLAPLLSQNAAQFKALGLDSKESAVLLGKVEMSGMKTSVAIRGLQTAMKNASKDNKTLDQALSGFSDTMNSNASSSEKLSAAYELFGSRAGGAIYNAVESGKLSLDDLNADLSGMSGNVKETFENTLDPIDRATIAWNKSKIALADIGGTLLHVLQPAFDDASEAVEKFSKWWESLPEGTQDAISKFALFAAAAGPVLTVVGKTTEGVGGLVKGFGKLAEASGKSSSEMARSFAGGLSEIGSAIVVFEASYNLTKWFLDSTSAGKQFESWLVDWSDTNANVFDMAAGKTGGWAERYNKAVEDVGKALKGETVDQTRLLGELTDLQEHYSGSWTEEGKAMSREMSADADAIRTIYAGRKNDLSDLNDAYTTAADELKDAQKDLNSSLEEYGISPHIIERHEAYAKAVESGVAPTGDMITAEGQFNAAVLSSGGAISAKQKRVDDCTAAVQRAKKAVDDAEKSQEKSTQTDEKQSSLLPKITAYTGNLVTARLDAVKAAQQTTAAEEKTSSAYGDMAANLVNYIDKYVTAGVTYVATSDAMKSAMEEQAAREKEAADTKNDALKSVSDTFKGVYDSIAGTTEISLFKKLDTGEDQTVEQMIQNMHESNAEVDQMQQEQAAVIEKYGSVLGPKLVSSLEEMGTEGASTWHHMFVTMSQDNSDDLFKQMHDEFTKGLDNTEEISSASAANVTAYKMMLGDLGSQPVEWTTLEDGVKKLNVSDDIKSQLTSAAESARSAGVKIPDEIASGIADGSIEPADAISQLNALTEGQYEGLVSVAKQAGISVPESIADGIDGSSDSYSSAVQKLATYLTGSGVDWSSEAKKAGVDLASGATSGVEGGSGKAQNAGSKLGEMTKAGYASWENAFYNVSSLMGENASEGLRSKSGAMKSSGSALANAAKAAIESTKLKLPEIGTQSLSSARANVSAAVAAMKRSLDFSWRLPTLHGSLPSIAVDMHHASSSDGKTKVSYPNLYISGYRAFAEGGIVTGATLFGKLGSTGLVAGEQPGNPEAIVPLDKLSQMIGDYGGVTFNNTFNLYGGGTDQVEEIIRELKIQMRTA